MDFNDQEYDYIILGTGLTECLLSGGLALIQKKVLHIDSEIRYGSMFTDFNLKQFIAFCDQLNKKEKFANFPIEIIQLQNNLTEAEIQYYFRDFSIELQPKTIFSKSKAVDMMLLSGVSNYMEFQNLHATYIHHQNTFHTIPLSKSEIFQNKILSLIEKRTLVKFIEQCLSLSDKLTDEEIDQNSTHVYEINRKVSPAQLKQIETHQNERIEKFMEAAKMNDKIRNILLYCIGCLPYNVLNNPEFEMSTLEFCNKVSKYLRSIHQYGDTPILVPLYGASTFPQAFSRLSAVFGSVFMININFDFEKIEINEDSENKGIEIKVGEKVVKGKNLISGREYAHLLQKEFQKHNIELQLTPQPKYLKTMIVIVKSILLYSTVKAPIIAIIPPNSFEDNTEPIRIVYKNYRISCTPECFFTLHISILTSPENESHHSKILANLKENMQTLILDAFVEPAKLKEYKELINGKEEPNLSAEPKNTQENVEKDETKEELEGEEIKEQVQIGEEKNNQVVESVKEIGEEKQKEKEKKKETEKEIDIKYVMEFNQQIRSCNLEELKMENISVCKDSSFDFDIDEHFDEAQKIFDKFEKEKEFLKRPEEFPTESYGDDVDDEDELIKELTEKLTTEEKKS